MPRRVPLIAAICMSAICAPLTIAPALAVPGPGELPGIDRQAAPRREAPVLVAQNQEAAQLIVRIQQLEEQIRNLTGQVEGLQFQLTQMQTMLETKQADDEFRFQQLEGGAGASPPPSNARPQLQEQPGDRLAPGQPEPPELEDHEAPMDEIGDSRDPQVGRGAGETPLGQLPEDALKTPGGQPLDLRLANVDGAADPDADAQYAAAYDAIQRGDFAFAEDQFRQFVELYPTDARAPDATNWLGDALLQRSAYEEAADVLLTGFEAYPNSSRAPDLLLKLGIALYGADEREAACRTFSEVDKRYGTAAPAFRQRLADERAHAQCPAG